MKQILFIAAFLTTVGAAAQKMQRLNLQEGTTYTLESVNTSESKQIVGGVPQESTTINTNVTDYVVTGMEGKNYMIDVVPRSMKVEQKTAMGSNMTDSGGDSINPMNRIMRNLTNKPLKLVLSPAGEVISFSSNGYTDTMMEGVEMDDMMKLQIEGSIKAEMTDEKLRQTYLEAFKEYALMVAKKDATWKNNMKSVIMAPMDMNTDNKVVAINKETITIDSKGTLTTNGKQDVMMMGMNTKMDLSGDLEATRTLDRKTGWIKTATTKSMLKGQMVIGGGDSGIPETVIDTETETTVKVTGSIKEM